MAALRFSLALMLCSAALHAVAVEYELDKPLDLAQGWRFLRREDIYMQHRCSAATVEQMAKRFSDSSAAYTAKLAVKQTRLPLQMRLYGSAQLYRHRFKFSKQREAHFNPRLNIITSHCGVSPTVLNQQILLHVLQHLSLRPWQKVFIAEVLASGARTNPFAGASKAKSAPIAEVMLSNHVPQSAERAALARLTNMLLKAKKLEEFAVRLADERLADDTGIELLERLLGTTIEESAKNGQEAPRKTGGNNTLRTFRK